MSLRRYRVSTCVAATLLSMAAASRGQSGSIQSPIAPYLYHSPASVDESDRRGSTNVPMDNWVYPALERLAALGFIPSRSVAIRPWTRQECLRQVREVEESLYAYGISDTVNEEAARLLSGLRKELDQSESDGIVLESAYTRFGTIAGPALADSYHFGQTWWNDFGRPLGRGFNAINGFSARATHGRLFFYAREEAQHGPGVAAQSTGVTQLFDTIDTLAGFNDPFIQPPASGPAYNRYRPIELYAGVAFAGNALSFGKQQLYWGPNLTGPFAFSSNAEPTWNLRLVATRPHPFPGPFKNIGTYRFDLVAGKLSGHHYPARPFFDGGKFDFTLGSAIEISVTHWSILCGQGHPCSFNAFIKNITNNSTFNPVSYGDPNDAGDRKSGFDFRFTPPGLHRLITLYADSYADDEVLPVENPNRSAYSPGIYIARLPGLPHMDLRVESISSKPYAGDKYEGGYLLFWNNQYLDANTNKGFLLGNAVGRDGRALDSRLGYWFSARTRVEAGFRQNKGGLHFLPGGATISDGFVNASYAITSEWSAQLFTQYERFNIPSYLSGSHHNESGWFQLTWNPKLRFPR